jgi:hypothetical protein
MRMMYVSAVLVLVMVVVVHRGSVAAAFAPLPAPAILMVRHRPPPSTIASSSSGLYNHLEKGAGGMFDTRNPDAIKHEDARKSIGEAPTFEEYMKMRATAAAPAPAPGGAASASAAPAPAPAPAAWSPPAPDSWVQPVAAATAGGSPPPFSTWGQPAAAATTAAAAAVAAPPAAPLPLPLPQSTATANAGVSSWASPATSSAAGTTGAGDPISLLSASQAATVASIAQAIPDLAPKPDLSWTADSGGGGGVSLGGCAPVTLDARDAAGPANVAWLASVCVPTKLSSLTVFSGPLTDVPHLLSRCCVLNNDGKMMMRLDLDFRPRAYGAYDLVRPDGSYPGPEELGRKAFEYSGARLDFDTKFGNDHVKAFLDAAKASLEGAAIPNAAPTTALLDILTGSPLALSLVMPITNGNIHTVAKVREQAAAAWLQWTAMEKGRHNHRPGAPINTQYVYDAKFRQNAYSALLPLYTSLLGADDGARLAAAESGPLDEAYVGGGS